MEKDLNPIRDKWSQGLEKKEFFYTFRRDMERDV